MTHREHRLQGDREYITELMSRHRTVKAAAAEADVPRSQLYRIAERTGVKIRRFGGNTAWKSLRQ